MSRKKDAIVASFANVPFDDNKDNLFSTKHTMTNKELLGQTRGYVGELIKEYVPGRPVCIGVSTITGNGARVVVGVLDSDGSIVYGYSTRVYAIAKRLGIVGKLCDMFEEGQKVLTADEKEILMKFAR